MKKFIKISFLAMLIILFLFTVTYGFSIEDLDGTGGRVGNIKTVGNKTITVISVLGSIISVVALIALGIKYMLGSVEEKAEYKKSFLPYVIGATFVFAASAITGMIYSIIPK